MNTVLSQNIWLPCTISNGIYGNNWYGLATVIFYGSEGEAIYLNITANTSLKKDGLLSKNSGECLCLNTELNIQPQYWKMWIWHIMDTGLAEIIIRHQLVLYIWSDIWLTQIDTQWISYASYSEYIETIMTEWAAMTNILQQDNYI